MALPAQKNQQNKRYDDICKKLQEKGSYLKINRDNRGLDEVQPEAKNEDKPISSKPSTQSYPPPQTQAPQRPPTLKNTVIVFDFEDILFPTSKLCQIYPGSNYLSWYELSQLSRNTYNMLLAYIQRYSKENICIITSSDQDQMKHELSQVSDIGDYAKIYDLIFDPQQKDPYKISIYHEQTRTKASCRKMLKEKEDCFNDVFGNDIWTPPRLKTLRRIFHEKAIHPWDHSVINTFVIIGESLNTYVAAGQLREAFEDKNMFINRIQLEYKRSIVWLSQEQNELQELCDSQYYAVHTSLKQWFDIQLLA